MMFVNSFSRFLFRIEESLIHTPGQHVAIRVDELRNIITVVLLNTKRSAGLGSHLGIELWGVDYEPIVTTLRDRVNSIIGDYGKTKFASLHFFQFSLY